MSVPIQPFRQGAGSDKLNELVAAVNRLLAMTGDPYIAVERGATGFAVRLQVDKLLERIPRPSTAQLYGKVVSAEELSANRWTYTIHRCNADGDVGESSEPAEYTAYNSMEKEASDSGVQPNGLDVDGLANELYTFALAPIGPGAFFPIWRAADPDALNEFWFCVPNQPDGGCNGQEGQS